MAEKFSFETFALSLVGAVPFIGDITKDQLANYVASKESERIYHAIDRLRATVSKRLKRTVDQSEIPRIVDSVLECIEIAKREVNIKKRTIIVDLFGAGIADGLDLDRVSWFGNALHKMSIQSISLLIDLSKESPRPGHQFHSHSGIFTKMEEKYGYPFLASLVKELSLFGLIDSEFNQSSLVASNARFVVWWRSVSVDFINYLRG